MTDSFSKLSDAQRLKMKDLLSKWDSVESSSDDIVPHDWKSQAIEALKVGDISGIRKAVAPTIQYGVAEIALTSKSDALRLQASQFVLAQEGHGQIQKVEQSVSFEKMTRDQLVSVVKSKMDKLKSLDPNLDLAKLCAPKEEVIDVEFTEEKVSVD
jgi:hypothetical protein